MKTSLIVTTYNSPVALSKVLDSILFQSRMPDEILIADDGSDAETAGVVKAFTGKCPVPVVHVWQEDEGFRLAKIRNEAIKQSTGEYVIFLDGDCVVNRHFIADHLLLSETDCFVQGKRVHVRPASVPSFSAEDANSFPRLAAMALRGKISNTHHLLRLPTLFARKSRKLKGIKGCNMGFFKEDLVAVNGFNEDFVGWGSEDSEIACRLFLYGIRKKVHQFAAICFHLWHPSNKSQSMNRELLKITCSSGSFFCKNGLVKTP